MKIDRIKYPKMGLMKNHTSETRRKMSISRKGKKLSQKHIESLKKRFSGKGNNSWIDGRSKISGYKLFLNERRRALKLNANGSHTIGDWETLKTQYNWTCPSCKKKEPVISLTEDHIIPLSKGGSDNIENIQPLCRSCNSRKHTNLIKY